MTDPKNSRRERLRLRYVVFYGSVCICHPQMLHTIKNDSERLMLVCGSDLLRCFGTPEQVRIICRDYGVICICREGQDVEKIINDDTILNEYRMNIKVVDDLVPNQISSTRIRECISRRLSMKYLTADEVIEYNEDNHLYLSSSHARDMRPIANAAS